MESTKRKIALVVASLIVTSCISLAQVKDLAVLGVGEFTNQSVGDVISGPAAGQHIVQASRSAPGLSIDYRQWWGNNAASLSYTLTPTDSELKAITRWRLVRNEFRVSWVHRIRNGRVSPYFMTGIGAILLDGGKASGLDRQLAIAAGAGSDVRISSHIALRYGLDVDFLRASNFSDRTFRGGRTFLLKPKFGVVWTFRSKRPKLTLAERQMGSTY